MFNRRFFWIGLITFFESWVLGFLRFQFESLHTIYQIINFPFGFIYLEQEENLLKVDFEVSILNGEIFQSIVWIISVFLQAMLFSWIYVNTHKLRSI